MDNNADPVSTLAKQRVLPQFVSVSRMVGNAAELSGVVSLGSLDQLLGLLADPEGNVSVELQFGKDDEGRRLVSGSVEAELSVYCQRCLDAMMVPVQQSFSLGLVDDEEQAHQLPEHLEPLLVADDGVSLYELVAEELLLALPIVSAHAEQCGEQQYMREPDEHRVAPRQKPFEGLANLLGKQ